MKFVIQRVASASVDVEGETVSSIGRGILVLAGIHREDIKDDCSRWVDKILKLRIFPDEDKPINRSVQDIQGEILLISQFTLYGDTKGQNRPSFMEAAKPEQAKEIYEHLVELFQKKWPSTQTGEFAADMKVALLNDGPVTIVLE